MLVYHSSIIPIVAGPVIILTLFAGGVALASIVFGKHIALTNNVGECKWFAYLTPVPLLSVVVGLLLGECNRGLPDPSVPQLDSVRALRRGPQGLYEPDQQRPEPVAGE